MNDELKEKGTQPKKGGFVQKNALGIAFLITSVGSISFLILAAWIEPLGKILFSHENSQTTTQVIIIASLVAIWFLWVRLKKRKNE